MSTQDTCVTIHPYFKVAEGKLGQFKSLCEELVEKTNNEPMCLYYGVSFDGNLAFVREGYKNAQGLLDHLENAGNLIGKALEISELVRTEVHGTEYQLNQLGDSLASLNPQYFVLEYGFRR